MQEPRNYTPEEIESMREWIVVSQFVPGMDLGPDVGDPSAMSADEVVAVVTRSYEGGPEELLASVENRPDMSDDFDESVEWQDLPWGGDDDFASWDSSDGFFD